MRFIKEIKAVAAVQSENRRGNQPRNGTKPARVIQRYSPAKAKVEMYGGSKFRIGLSGGGEIVLAASGGVAGLHGSVCPRARYEAATRWPKVVR
jgi:hypothetical protein